MVVSISRDLDEKKEETSILIGLNSLRSKRNIFKRQNRV